MLGENNETKQETLEDSASDSQMIFEMTVPSLFESIQQSLQETISHRLSSMPLLDTKDNKMVDDIWKRYSQDMEAVELYSMRYLFGIRKKLFTTKQREKIIQKYISRKNNENIIQERNECTSLDQEADVDRTMNNLMRIYEIPSSVTDVPTEEQINKLDLEIFALRKKLRSIKAESTLLSSQLKSLQNARNTTEKLSLDMSEQLGQTSAENVLDSVTAAIIGREGLTEMTEKGKKVIMEMKYIKSQKEETNETAEFSEMMKAKAKALSFEQERPKKKMTLEEDFEQRKDLFELGSS